MVTKRSIIIDGSVTSISMEPIFWQEVDRRAEQLGLPWQDYMRRLLSGLHDAPNRSSAVRETLVGMLQDEGGRQQRPRLEAWWQLKSGSEVRETGTKGVRLFAGRGGVNDLVFDDAEVSRRHLMLVYDGRHWWAIDLESKNGLYLGRKRVPMAKLQPGKPVRIGNSELTLLQS
ncbi:hypothetical protein C2E25_16585 [Geothermobacter hydrogeniphilus]|uniref:FHA domain-containing protein n=1 Tax=Geothermobacter hydrogeniphilus TaxID=1969733 RepID=A0A2K2H5W8_9BACT|nr:FHA domain-containing protein [Geothermobacter hydrogeniphilus]PNU18639.1 hypothetical protein C2E25_16585 [Geothermobacter hydrogeniphilus]